MKISKVEIDDQIVDTKDTQNIPEKDIEDILMPILVFDIADWMIIEFDLPKKDSPDRFI